MTRTKKLQPGVGVIAMDTSRQKLFKLFDTACEAFAPREILDLDDWSDLYRVLPRETSAEHGEWVTARFPFIRRIMKCMSPSSIARESVAIKGSQLGFTEIAICLMLYVSKVDPGPGMYVQKTGDAAQDFSTQKLKPSIEVCREVDETLGDKKSKSLSNAWDNKGFPGGFWVMGGANSGAFLRSKSIKYALVDEEDSYDASIDSEGSPVAMIRKRQQTFGSNRKMLRISTPKIKETSTIEPAFWAGSQERYYLPCPRCGTNFVLLWEHIKYSKECEEETSLPADIYCECPHCAGRIDEHEKNWMLQNGVWMSENGSPGEPYVVGDVEFPSFHISSLYSPYGFFGWRDAVKEWFDYKRTNDIALLQVFINQTLGESFSLVGHDVNSDWMYGRREVYAPDKSFDIPMGGLVLTAGVDIQDDRLEVDVRAWGLYEESWAIDYVVFMGDTSDLGNQKGMTTAGLPTCWALLDQYLMREWQHESGEMFRVECALIDAQYHTEEACLFSRLREHRRIFPSHGKDGWGKGFYKRPQKRHERYQTWNFTLWVDELKNKVQSMLKIDQVGPGYAHFPKKPVYNEKYFKGLTSESKQLKWHMGKQKIYWHCPSGARNEPWDTMVYAYAALHIYRPDLESRAKNMALMSDGGGGVGVEQRVANSRPRRKRGHPGL